jgi:hypothetical protein
LHYKKTKKAYVGDVQLTRTHRQQDSNESSHYSSLTGATQPDDHYDSVDVVARENANRHYSNLADAAVVTPQHYAEV